MNQIVANRLGLLLSFLAGFLLAPELIGQERLNRFENWLEEKATTIAGRMQGRRKRGVDESIAATHRLLSRINPEQPHPEIKPVAYSFAYSAKQLIGCYGILLVVSTLIAIIVNNWLVRVILVPILAVSGFVVGFIAVWGTTLLALRLLRGSNRLRTLMVLVGICLYVAGNLLQFWATF